VQAEQDALRGQNNLERIKFEAEQKIVTARAEDEKIKMESCQLKWFQDKQFHLLIFDNMFIKVLITLTLIVVFISVLVFLYKMLSRIKEGEGGGEEDSGIEKK